VWELTRLPEGKILLPGMISHSTAHVEHPELVAQRILRYAKLVGPENVIAGSDCGFAQGTATARQHPVIVRAKLEALAAGARIATQRLRK
jgi:5-methyltetrahydropteroyltriglutamate--homocysteine methyltransferase